MDDFLASNQQRLKTLIKEVDQYDKGLRSLSTWWEKIALIGKINSYEVASTILQDMDDTLGQFNTLQNSLISSLTNEHTRKLVQQNSSRAQMAIDVLIRNLFERTADIDFLSTDHELIEFVKNSILGNSETVLIEERLRAYINIYSVYQDAIILSLDGDVIFQLTNPTRTEKVRDELIQQAVSNPDEYVEYFGETDIIEGNSSHLLYANAIVENDEVIGVIVLCFRFDNELEGIVERLLYNNESNHFMLLNGAGEMLFAPQCSSLKQQSRLSLKSSPDILSFNDTEMMKIYCKGQPYQDYSGPNDWYMASLLSLENIKWGNTQEKDNNIDIRDLTGLISDDLLNIRKQSISINDDLQLIVLNGIIAAARKKSVEFMPVLEAIKRIGLDIDNIFDRSIESLFSAIISGQLDTMRLQASLAVDIMDRNLFERANDCRWWGLSGLLRTALAKKDSDSIHNVLSEINALYTVYHTLYVYDDQGCYVAFSDEQYNDKIGSDVEIGSGADSLFQLQNEYQYTVSSFKPFDCYKGESTYIYNAAIRHATNHENIIGGIGVVFDSTIEFNAILNDILPRENNELKAGAKALFTTNKGFVIASSDSEHAIGSHFLPEIDLVELEENSSVSAVINISGTNYLLGAAKSTGYREYKRDDGYENNIIAWVLSPC